MIFLDDFCGYERYTIDNGELAVSVVTLGATVTSLRFAGRETVLAYPDAEGLGGDTAYVCATVGRYANRIAGARFTLGGQEHVLAANEGRNQLHGGPNAFNKRVWTAEKLDNSVRFTLVSPDGDNGFPGELRVSVTYAVEGAALRIDYEALSDADTVYAPTTHFYFDLGGGTGALDAELAISASHYLAVDAELIPTGELAPAVGEFDFSTLRRVGRNYDHCFVLDGEHACTASAGGIKLDMYTDLPAVQVYTSEFLGAPFGKNMGLAIEPEFFPDSPNRPEFPSTVLKKGERFHKYARLEFSKA